MSQGQGNRPRLLRGFAWALTLWLCLAPHAQAQQVVKICTTVVSLSSGIPVTSCQDTSLAGKVGQPMVSVQAPLITPILSSAQNALSVTTAASPTVPTGATYLVMECTGAVNYEDDGGTPTSSTGIGIATGSQFTYGGNLAALKVIAQSGSQTCNFLFYK